MDFDVNLLSVSHFLEKHPVLKENVKYKVKYLNVLEFFVNKYSNNDFSQAMLANYKTAFLGKDIQSYTYSEHNIKKKAKGATGVKFKGFKLFTYRYSLVCDTFFINSFTDSAKAVKILNEIKTIFKKRYHKKLHTLFTILYQNLPLTDGLDQVSYQVDAWKLNQQHINQSPKKILITATMSAGKSTLINALVGKTVTRTMNEACTAKLHYIYDKSFEDGMTYGFDKVLHLNADEKTLLHDEIDSKGVKKYVSTYFRHLNKKQSRLCLIDTPGINSSLNRDHTQITLQTIRKEKYDKVLYVVNAENIGTTDDQKYLQFICEQVGEDKLIFVVNKLDRFRVPQDSIDESIQNLREDLKKLGINHPIICPVSSYAGVLAKKKLFGLALNEDEADDFLFLKSKFNKEDYNLSKFYSGDGISMTKDMELLKNCGLLGLEQIISQGASHK
jgi:small GTP-binding protein